MIIVVIKKTKEFRHSQFVYKISIAISDIIWSLGVCVVSGGFTYVFGNIFFTCQLSDVTSTLVNINNSIVNKDVYCKILDLNIFKEIRFFYICLVLVVVNGLLMLISITVSLVSLIFAAADRYFALAFPLKYKSKNTIKLAKISSAFIWILSTILHVFTIFVDFSFDFEFVNIMLQPSDGANVIFVSVLVFVLFFLLWLLTILTVVSLYKSYKKSLKLNRRTIKKIAPEKQMSLVLIIMVVAFTFSLSPTLYNHAFFYIYKSYDIKSENILFEQPFIAVSFLLTNSVWNVLIYNFLNKQFRTALKALFRKTN